MNQPAANAWYPLGGQRTTAQSSSISMQEYRNLTPGARQHIARLQQQGLAHYNVGTECFVISSAARDPESSAAWQSQQSAMRQALDQQIAQAAMQQAQVQQTVVYSTGENPIPISSGFVSLAEAAGYGQPNGLARPSSYINPNPPPVVVCRSTEATVRSMELFYDWLNPEQRKQLAVHGYIEVIGGDTGTRYRIMPPANYNVLELNKENDEVVVKLCFQPKDSNLPKGDIWLCQKLALELDEKETLEVANRSASYGM